jgi:large subunit ribosomal protein L10
VDKAGKREFVSWLKRTLKDSGSVVVVHYSGLTVAQMNDLRSKMREAGGAIKVAKNRLAKIALQDTEMRAMARLFVGQTLIAYSSNPLVAPKVVVNFSKVNDSFFVLGGTMGSVNLDIKGVEFLASLPALDDLRAKIVCMISTPATRVAQVLAAPATQMTRVFNAFSRKK